MATAPTTTTTSYAGFNLLLLEPGTTTTSGTGNAASAELTYDARLLTNGGGGGRIRARTLSDAERACGGMSNGVDGEGGDAWPKVVQGRAALRSILDEIEEEDHKDQDQDQEGTSGGPDHEIADADDAADSRLAERLIELLTYVTASCIGFGSFSPMSFLSLFLYFASTTRSCPPCVPRRAFHATHPSQLCLRKEDQN